MSLNDNRVRELNALCQGFRRDLIERLYRIQTGHPGGSLSCCELLTTLYFEMANIHPGNADDPNRDYVVLSKGHAAPMLYLILAEKGFFPTDDLKTLRQAGSHLQGHPCALHTPGVEVSTGPLGLGYSIALGIAVANRLSGHTGAVYALVGDGELGEGVIWEAALAASKFKADNLITIVDRNHVQLDGTSDAIMPLLDIGAKFSAFGFEVFSCDGHNVAEICESLEKARAVKGKPSVLIAETVKGKGLSFMEGKNIWHGKPIADEEYRAAMAELEVQ